MSGPGPTVYIPIESKSRELGSRLLLARALVERGLSAVVGYGETVNIGANFWPRGIYLLKGLNAVQKQIAAVLTGQGHAVAVLDEEALGIADPWFMTKDVDSEIAPLITRVLCQGPMQAAALRDRRGFRVDQLPVTGNPRIDLLRPPLDREVAARADQIRQEHGRFVLVNTNSGSINNLWGDQRRYLGLLIEIGWFNPDDPDDRALVDDHLEHDRNNFRALREMVTQLCTERPDIPVIIRPHPSERPEVWMEFARDKPSVRVVSETEPAPWLRAAEVVVTTGCTTGMEAFVLGRPAISLIDQPEHVRHPGFFVANAVGTIARTPAQVVRWVHGHWSGGPAALNEDIQARKECLARHVDIDEGILAARKAAAVLAEMPLGEPGSGARQRKELAISPPHESRLRRTVKRVRWRKGAFERAEIDAWLDSFDRLLGPRVALEVSDLTWSAFVLRPAA